METRPAATKDASATDAPAGSLETNFLLSVFAELSGRPRPQGGGSGARPAETAAVPSDRAPSGT